MANLKNKVAIVTGGSSGIGEAVVRRLSAEGAKVFFSYRNHRKEAEAMVAELEKEGFQVAIAPIDLGNVDTIVALTSITGLATQ